MRGVSIFVLLIMAGVVYSSQWITDEVSVKECKSSADAQMENLYDKCQKNCNYYSLMPFSSGFFTEFCKTSCKMNYLYSYANFSGFDSCKLNCYNSNSAKYFACLNTAGNCSLSDSERKAIAICLNNCMTYKNLGPKDRAYYLCNSKATINKGKGFLRFPFESTGSVIMSVAWNYTKGWPCSNYTSDSPHNAIDYAPKNRSMKYNVTSASDGTVIYVDNTVTCSYNDNKTCPYGYGSYVKIKTQNPNTQKNYSIVYGHLKADSITLKVGDKVKVGDVIGEMSNSGYAYSTSGGDGTHLHFEIKDLDKEIKVDPYDLYSIKECEYPHGNNGYKCGPNHLWQTCPPN
ncbi:M23 family metallopeptidase [Candidatus Micrarchaeota archaeon]|nr:M23 family metallopeptidase [Candidatus Micrarchaeota archaeon]